MLVVQCDFDDTITVGNVSTLIREAFAPEDWVDMEREYYAGRYSVEESNIRQFARITASQAEIERYVVQRSRVRPGFVPFVEKCRQAGIRLMVASSGLDLYIRPILASVGLGELEAYSARATVTPAGIHVSYSDASGSAIDRGFKESHVRNLKAGGDTVVYVGDGASDVVAARESDHVIARSTLERHFAANGLPHYTFQDFTDVWRHVEAIHQGYRSRGDLPVP